ncbi:MAG TPA: amidohydrolase family protein, partial [Polyangiales bacterium]|nr:amidohydrolase family protein [Polyangiales bacterium]
KRKKTAPELPLEPPIWLGNKSNGEFFHQSTPMEQKIRAEILRQAEEKSRKLGMDRREFLASAMGMCTTLSVMNLATACSDSGKKPAFIDMGAGTGASGVPGGAAGMGAPAAGGGAGVGISGGAAGTGLSGSSGTGASGTGSAAGRSGGGASGMMGGTPGSGGSGGFVVPPAATMDCDMALELLKGDEFILDCQTHHIELAGSWKQTNPFYGDTLATYFSMYNMCMDADLKNCIDAQTYLEKIFLESDTSVAVLSGFPAPLCTDGVMTNCGNPLDNDAMWKSRDRFNALAKSQRVINHCQVNPTDNLQLQLAIMEKVKTEHDCWGFKSYPEWGPNGVGWMLDDPKSGIPFIEQARKVNSKIICIHKGIVFPGWDRAASHPKDVGVVAKMYPDTKFVVYHSAIEIDGTGEGPYNPNNTQGTDRLCQTVESNGLRNMNVYAELGSVWAQVMSAPEKAQHVIGKLLKYVGEDNVVWGTETIWLGGPQPQIEAFRTFQISKQFQDMYGYPELTPEIKRKIFGLNAAKIYNIDPEAKRCQIKATTLTAIKEQMDGELGTRRWAFTPPGGPRTRREFWNLARLTGGKPG